MRRCGLFLGIIGWLFVACTTALGDERPNIVFFLTDDQRHDFLGCAGHSVVRTPTIDRLAAVGVRFDRAFVTTPICAASRASILTGTVESSHGYTFGTPPLRERLARHSYPALLRGAGYRTGFVGKFGVRSKLPPKGNLFDEFHPLGQPFLRKGPDGKPRHTSDLIGDRAIEFVRESKRDRPFCLSVSFAAPHAIDGETKAPYPTPSTEAGLYDQAVIPPPLVPASFFATLPKFLRDSMHRDRWQWRWDTEAKYVANTKSYFGMITAIDRNVGRVLDELRRRGLDQNTVVVFTSDNGYYKGSRGFAGKWSHFDEALRVPLVIFDPRVPKSRRGRIDSSLALNIDLAPTLLELAGATPSKLAGGRSLVPILRDQPVKKRRDFYCEHRFDHPRIPKWEGVRGERYVYARYYEHGPSGEFLHDLVLDPLQLRNLATDPEYADILAEMNVRCTKLRPFRLK